jgi:hypothetical protein
MTKNIEFPNLESALLAYSQEGDEYYPDEPEVACLRSKLCPDCGGSAYFLVPVSATVAFAITHHVTNSFPMMNRDQRERFITGYCVPCWDNLFAKFDEELDEE